MGVFWGGRGDEETAPPKKVNKSLPGCFPEHVSKNVWPTIRERERGTVDGKPTSKNTADGRNPKQPPEMSRTL